MSMGRPEGVCAPANEELLPGATYQDFLRAALSCRTEAEFRRTPFFVRHGEELDRLLITPRVTTPRQISPGMGAPAAGAPGQPSGDAPGGGGASVTGPLRVVHWNIEKGRSLEGIARRILDDPWLRGAGVYCLNEIDRGTARGGNLDQPRALAERLGCVAVDLPCYIECTRGVGADLLVPGEHRLGLHGLAILTRLPVLEARAAVLPHCHEYFDFHEKRYGGRRGLYVRLLWRGRPLLVATTHLEVRNTPKCRARQFDAFLRGLEPFTGMPAIVTGDWNTSTFRRGTLASSAAEFVRILFTAPEDLARQLIDPSGREPLFSRLAAAGFRWREANEAVPTAEERLGRVEDLGHLHPRVAARLLSISGLADRVLRMRLDWIATRDLRAAGPSRTWPAGEQAGVPLSDHALIGAEVA